MGKYLVRKILLANSGQATIISGKIVETEAYCGPNDQASHAFYGRTKRTEIMFGKPGLIYVYLIYGMYHCLNVVTEKENYPAAVLIRGLEVEQGAKRPDHKIEDPRQSRDLALSDKLILDGPGKLCRELKIDRSFCGRDICKNNELWIEDRGEKIQEKSIIKTPRIGVDYAGEYRNKLWRFVLI